MSDNKDTRPFLAGFLLGGLVGGAAALLMTPQSGAQTRFQIQTKGIELKNQASEKSAQIQERGKVIIDERLPSRVETSSEEPTELPTDEAGAAADAEAV